ncbi:DMT family transporter [Parvibaculum sp.]|uniref:DMT family transporter n=1 Tax=Parvibaculum sp. TaxID=2024848 RepID=UPI0032988A7D
MSRWLMLAILVALWGSAFAFAKIAVATVAPEWTMAGRLTAGAFLLLPLALWAGVRFPRAGGEWGWLAALALVGNIAPFFAISWGQQYVPSALAGILIGFTPLATLVLAHFLIEDERITPLRAAGFVIGFTGLVIVLGPRALTDLTAGGERLFGQFAILAGAFFFACNNVMARRAPEMPLLVKSSGVMLAGALAGTALASAVTSPLSLGEASTASLLGIAGLGIFSTGLAALVFFRLVDKAGATFVSLTNYLVPVFAAVAGFLIFDEELKLRVLMGLALILAGIAVSEWHRKVREQARHPRLRP